MKRSFILLIFSVLVCGCQSMPHEQEPTVLVEAQQQPGAAEKFLVKAAKFFRPSAHETNDIDTKNPVPKTFSAAKPPYSAVSDSSPSPIMDPAAFHVPVRPKSSIQASQMLFNFDVAENIENTVNEITEPESLEESSSDSAAVIPPTRKPSSSPVSKKIAAKTNILQAQEGDSEQFQQFLKLIGKTPKEERGVDDAKLEQLLTKFRSDLEEMPDLETNYLLVLRKKILPNYQPQKKTVTPKRDFKSDEESEYNDEYYADDDKEERNPAPLPPLKPDSSKIVKSIPNRRNVEPPENDQEEEVTESNDRLPVPRLAVPPSAFPATASTAAPLPLATNKPLYPNLTQLENPQPIIPAGYNPQYGHQSDNQHNGASNIVHADYNTGYNTGSVPSNVPNNKDWDSLVRMGADQLRYKIEQTPNGRTFANEGRLRLLETVLGNRNEAVKPIQGTDKPVNEFMANQMLGLAAFLDEVGTPDQRTRNVNALFRFDEGLMELRKVCPIKLRKIQIVKAWDAFGCFIPRNEDCHANEILEVYMELENPTVRRTQQGFNVSASVSYEIRDMSAKVLRKSEPNNVQETTPSQKRDYCVGLRVQLPSEMPPGSYQLRINVTDLNDETMQYTEEQIPFKVVPVVSPEN